MPRIQKMAVFCLYISSFRIIAYCIVIERISMKLLSFYLCMSGESASCIKDLLVCMVILSRTHNNTNITTVSS